MSDYDRSIHSNPDAAAWAKFFGETFPPGSTVPDEGTMLGWFANAMMAMHDRLKKAPPPAPEEPVRGCSCCGHAFHGDRECCAAEPSWHEGRCHCAKSPAPAAPEEPAGRNDDRYGILLALETFRGVAQDDVCPGCSGWGKRVYGSTAGHRGGIGGQVMTLDVCNKCWGSGSASRPWPAQDGSPPSPPAAPTPRPRRYAVDPQEPPFDGPAAPEEEPGEVERALDTAAEVMERVASALHNGGGTGHEEVRLLEAVKRIRALRRERSKK